MGNGKVNVAIIGLGFGAEFIPIYQSHPDANMYAICQRSEDRLNEVGAVFGVEQRYSSFDDVLADPTVDFVHINSPIPDHGWMSIAALKAGKPVMCTVPMATTIEECQEIVSLVNETGLKYMMAETVVYSREFLFIKQLYNGGEFRQDSVYAGVAPTGHGGLARVLGAYGPHALCDPCRIAGVGVGRRPR